MPNLNIICPLVKAKDSVPTPLNCNIDNIGGIYSKGPLT